MKISAVRSSLHHGFTSRRWRWTASIAVIVLALTLGISGCVISQPVTGFAHTAIPDFQASPDRLRKHVRVLSEDFLGRGFDQPQTLQRAADYIVAELAQSGVTAERQRFEVGGQSYENLIARFGPVEGAKPLLVMGAHYDSALTHEGVPTPGADDNASGVAGLLELARLLVNKAPSQPVELVFYTLEEPPNFRTDDMGSYRHALSLQQRNQPVRLMLSIEMIGYYSDEPGSQTYPLAPLGWIYPDKGNFIGLIGELKNFGEMRRTKAVMRAAGGGQNPLEVHSLNSPRFVHGVDFSDHLNYWRLGYPAIMVTDTSFMRNPHYHQRTDTWERLDYTRMAQVVRMLAAVALATP
ncbi:M28 family peptidase [Comamonas sp. Y33R10-2]|uniref:M28 family peptidase n=1 Tax=Comamonas sp. Y33R10-2 TaxID=2853257 RepID=UPI001C5C8C30|nr:M28 family peptidase [Comamonas sp. Y33R10-2]QXZ09352.1 M28 family peptidase [Comamonas sp. Y33R10-2]